jgi:hypothetical protein
MVEGEALGHLPDEDLAIVGRRRNDLIVMGVPTRASTVALPGNRPCAGDAPVCVQHSSSVAAEQGYLVGQLSALVQGDDGKGTAAA